MIAHRAHRDIARCRLKYGDAWMEYEKRVPYLFIPVSLGSLICPNVSVSVANPLTVRRLIVLQYWPFSSEQTRPLIQTSPPERD